LFTKIVAACVKRVQFDELAIKSIQKVRQLNRKTGLIRGSSKKVKMALKRALKRALNCPLFWLGSFMLIWLRFPLSNVEIGI
jgi:hypothetical protein